MKTIGILLLGILFGLSALGREIDVRLWISGGMQGLVMGNRECPGWLSVARQLEQDDPDACWIQLGAPPADLDSLTVDGLKFPDVVVPVEADFRLKGLDALAEPGIPLTLLNVDRLPQFPDYVPPFLSTYIWRQPDGAQIQVYALISGQAPLRIPADRLRPLQIRSPLEEMREELMEHPLPEEVFGVVVLPEDASASDWSKLLPEFPVHILPAGTHSKVIEVRKGKQLRVQPAKFGRSLIRIQLYWDTVRRRFRDPKAEIVWVNAPDLQGVELSGKLMRHVRPLTELPSDSLEEALLSHADAALIPEFKDLKIESRLPDAVRVAAVPDDHAWVRVTVPRSLWNTWKERPGFNAVEHEDRRGDTEVLLTGATVAGSGEWSDLIRQDLLTHEVDREWMTFTSRDLILSYEEATP